MVDVIGPQDYACDDNELPEATEDIDPSDKQTTGVQEQTPQPSHFSDKEEVTQQPSPQGLGLEEEVEQVTQVTQPVSNIKTVELVECPDFKKKMTKQNAEVFSC